MNSLHITRNILAELHTYMEMEHIGKHRLNIENYDESQTLRTYFCINYFQESSELQNQAQRLPKWMPNLFLLYWGYIYSAIFSRDQPQNKGPKLATSWESNPNIQNPNKLWGGVFAMIIKQIEKAHWDACDWPKWKILTFGVSSSLDENNCSERLRMAFYWLDRSETSRNL